MFRVIYITRVTLVVQELPTFQKHIGLSPDVSGVRVAQPLDFCVMCCGSMFVLIYFVSECNDLYINIDI